jgi:hypothetical protein
MEIDKFDRETTDKYSKKLVKKYPKLDLHLLEFVVASYSLYDVKKREKPIEENEEFVRFKEVIEGLIERSHSRAPASEQRNKVNQ